MEIVKQIIGLSAFFRTYVKVKRQSFPIEYYLSISVVLEEVLIQNTA